MQSRREFLVQSALAAGTVTLGVPGRASGQPKMVLKAADVHALGYPTVEAIVRMGKKLEAATNGRLSIQMFPAMQLGGEKEMIEQAQVGALQIARIRGAHGPGGGRAERLQPAVHLPRRGPHAEGDRRPHPPGATNRRRPAPPRAGVPPAVRENTG